MKIAITLILTACALHGEELKFSTTQEVEPRVERMRNDRTLVDIDWTKIQLPNPPSSSEEAKTVEKTMERWTPEIQERIEEQMLFDYTYFDKAILDKPNTQLLFQLLENEIKVSVFHQKFKFDRVRPSFANPKIKPHIQNPGHPAYPSGHSTMGHVYGYVLAALNPANSKAYLALSHELAINRELAGVHYRSDSYVGMLLANRMIAELGKNDDFRAIFVAAATEWGTEKEAAAKLGMLYVNALKNLKQSQKQ